MTRVALLSLHTSPLVQPGGGDAGGMNVYVRELAGALAHNGEHTTVYVRRWADDLPDQITVEPGFDVVHVPAGPVDMPKEDLPTVVDEFAAGVKRHMVMSDPQVIHANYWLSGVAGRKLKDQLDLPLVSTFHTLARVKAETGDPEPQARIDAEAYVVGCSDVITANSEVECDELVRHYGADPARIEIVPPGVDRALFSPGPKAGARQALGLGDEPLLVFVGRIQALKGIDVAVEALAQLDDDRSRLLIVGGSSGADGDAYVERIQRCIDRLGVRERVSMVPPQPHHVLSTYYRAADLVIVPSRSESFGLVALEAAACGIPVVAADVGGLSTLVRHKETGLLVPGRDPADYADAVQSILDDADFAERLSQQAALVAGEYTWALMAQRLGEMYADLASRAPADCFG